MTKDGAISLQHVTVICRAFCIDPIAKSEVNMLDLC